jgi:GTP cyclohydrolase I
MLTCAHSQDILIKNSQDQDIDTMENNFTEILKSLGEDVTREGLVNTPRRAAAALRFLTRGYTQNLDEMINGAIFESDMDEMVLVKDIELYSLCEHHLLPFIGKCHVAYIPNGKIIGLSKVARVIDFHARRLQVQERLTKQIAECMMNVTNAKGVGVIIEAQHLCMMMRGVEKQNSVMKTSMMLGTFRTDSQSRAEFLTLAT